MVDIGLRVLTKPDPAALVSIYRRLGMDYDDKASRERAPTCTRSGRGRRLLTATRCLASVAAPHTQVLPSIVTEVVKQVIAQFNATALLTQREQVSRKIKESLEERAREFGILLEVRAERRHLLRHRLRLIPHLNYRCGEPFHRAAGCVHHRPQVRPRF